MRVYLIQKKEQRSPQMMTLKVQSRLFEVRKAMQLESTKEIRHTDRSYESFFGMFPLKKKIKERLVTFFLY